MQRIVKNFNAKIAYHRNKGVEEFYLPEKLSAAAIQKKAENEVMNEIRRAKEYLSRGSQRLVDFEHIKLSEFQVREIEQLVESSNQKRAERLAALERDQPGEYNSEYKRDRLGLSPRTFNPNKFRNREQVQRATERLKRQVEPRYYSDSDALLVKNYLRGVRKALPQYASEIGKAMQGINPYDFYLLFQKYESVFDVAFIYDLEGQEALANEMLETLGQNTEAFDGTEINFAELPGEWTEWENWEPGRDEN